MTQQFDPTNRGTLSRNDRKTEDKHPDFSGQACIKCPACNAVTDYWQSAWVKERKDGSGKFFSESFRQKEEKPAEQKPAGRIADMQDDIPF